MTLLELEQAKELSVVEQRNQGGVNSLRDLPDFVRDLGFLSEEEMVRVARVGGKIRVSPNADFEEPAGWKKLVLYSLGLPIVKHPNGVELTKVIS